MKEAATASAPAKVILFGEHFVVYDEPAIVLAIDNRIYVSTKLRDDEQIYIKSKDLEVSGFFREEKFQTEHGGDSTRIKLEPIRRVVQLVLNNANVKFGVNVEIHSSVPVSAGLGSSAAVAVSTVAALSHLLGMSLSKDRIFQFALEAERLVHGTPSGIDPAICTYGGILLFQKKEGFTPLNVKTDLPLVVGNTGLERSTGELVTLVRQKRERYSCIINPIIKLGGKIALEAVEAMKKGDLQTIGELMNINHALLSALDVSNESLDRFVYAAKKSGAYGAKLTGGGGGGCIIALAEKEKLKEVINAIEQAGGFAFIARKTNEGVRIEP